MKIFKTEKGTLCAEHQGRKIHSPYNPFKEAERFVKNSSLSLTTKVVLIGAGLGYLQQSLKDNYVDIKVLSLYTSDELFQKRFFSPPLKETWFPSSKETLTTFFRRNIQEWETGSIKVLEWEAGARIDEQLSLSISKILKERIQELNGNIMTTAWFGKKWLQNLIVNYLSIDNFVVPSFQDKPVLIASSGPSLFDSLTNIKKYRKRFTLIALPSSLKALGLKKISPDLVVSTDPGYYSSVHLAYNKKHCPVARPLTASRGIWRSGSSVFLLNQSTPYENDLLNLTGLKMFQVKSNGTVAGTALEIAAQFSQFITFTGLDLCFKDIQSHVKPHSFDTLLNSIASRFAPLHTIYYERAYESEPDFNKGIRTGRSLETYKNWFSRNAENSKSSLYRINPSTINIKGFKDADFNIFPDSDSKENQIPAKVKSPPRETKISQIQTLLSQWIKKLECGEDARLFYYLDTIESTGAGNRVNAIKYLKDLKALYG